MLKLGLLGGCAALLCCLAAEAVVISNVTPRRDTSGQIVVGGDGNIMYFNGKGDLAVPVAPQHGPHHPLSGPAADPHSSVCLSPHPGTYYMYAMDYGGCQEHPVKGTLCVSPLTNTTCGFYTNDSVVVYTSTTLASGSWQPAGVVLAPEDRPVGVGFRPKVSQCLWLLWSLLLPH